MREKNICPICGRDYLEAPALSRIDNLTRICPECGTRQALQDAGITLAEQEQIIFAIYRSNDFHDN